MFVWFPLVLRVKNKQDSMLAMQCSISKHVFWYNSGGGVWAPEASISIEQ